MTVVLSGYRLVVGLAGLGAFGLLLWLTISDGQSPLDFFSFFTNLSNLYVGVLLVYLAVSGRRGGRLDSLRGAGVLYLATTATVALVVLHGGGPTFASPLLATQTVMHQLVPVAVVLEWLVVPPQTRIRPTQVLAWLVFPIAFLAFSLVRGAPTGWYPYGFLNPGPAGGYAGVAEWCLGIAAGVLVMAVLIGVVGNLGRRARLNGAGAPPATAAVAVEP